MKENKPAITYVSAIDYNKIKEHCKKYKEICVALKKECENLTDEIHSNALDLSLDDIKIRLIKDSSKTYLKVKNLNLKIENLKQLIYSDIYLKKRSELHSDFIADNHVNCLVETDEFYKKVNTLQLYSKSILLFIQNISYTLNKLLNLKDSEKDISK